MDGAPNFIQNIDALPPRALASLNKVNNAALGDSLRFSFHASPSVQISGASVSPTVFLDTRAETREALRKAVIPVHINPATVDPVILRLNAPGGTATFLSDYGVFPAEVKIPKGKTYFEFPVPVINDRLPEGDETFQVQASIVSGFAIMGQDTVTVTIRDDDNKPLNLEPVFIRQPRDAQVEPGGTVVFSGLVNNATKYQWLRNGEPIDKAKTNKFTLKNVSPADNGAVFELQASNKYGQKLSAPAMLRLGPQTPVVTFLRSTLEVAESAGSEPVEVQLSTAAAFPVTINFTVAAGGTAGSGVDFDSLGNVTIPAGQVRGNGTIRIINDTAPEPDEVFYLQASVSGGGAMVRGGLQRWTIRDDDSTPPGTVATPGFSPAPGSYSGSVAVSLSTVTAGATIRYTTNGSDPTSSSTLYPGAINLTSTATLKARAFKSGLLDSAVASGTTP